MFLGKMGGCGVSTSRGVVARFGTLGFFFFYLQKQRRPTEMNDLFDSSLHLHPGDLSGDLLQHRNFFLEEKISAEGEVF